MTTKAKSAGKITPDEKKEIEKLFKAGMDAAMKDPAKFWDAENQKTAKTPVSKFLAKQPLVQKKGSKGKKDAKKESLADDLRSLLDSVSDD